MFLHRLWFQSIFTALYNGLQLTAVQILTPFSHSIGLLQLTGKHLFRSSESFLQSCVPLNCSQTVLQIPIRSLIFNLLPFMWFCCAQTHLNLYLSLIQRILRPYIAPVYKQNCL